MYNFLLAENLVFELLENLSAVHKNIIQTKIRAAPFGFKMKLRFSIKWSVLREILLFFVAANYRKR